MQRVTGNERWPNRYTRPPDRLVKGSKIKRFCSPAQESGSTKSSVPLSREKSMRPASVPVCSPASKWDNAWRFSTLASAMAARSSADSAVASVSAFRSGHGYIPRVAFIVVVPGILTATSVSRAGADSSENCRRAWRCCWAASSVCRLQPVPIASTWWFKAWRSVLIVCAGVSPVFHGEAEVSRIR